MTRKVKKKRKNRKGFGLDSWFLALESKDAARIKKAYRAEQKAALVEESKKGYTGDALALRGDEGRDKLR